MDSGADLDMMSTPLGKLPPPAMHSNKDTGPVTAPNYDDLRKSISIPRADERNQPPASPAPMMQQHMPPVSSQGGMAMGHMNQPSHHAPHTPRGQPQFDAHMNDYYDAPVGQYEAPGGRYDPTPPPPQQYAPNVYSAAPMPPPTYSAQPLPSPPSIAPSVRGHRKRKRRSVFSWETLKNKKMWLFAIMLFVIVAFGLPKLRAFFPSIIDPATGSTKLPALAGVSCVSALLFALTSEIV